MNRTQKEAFFNLIGFLLFLGILIHIFVSLFIIKRFPGVLDMFCVVTAIILLLAVMIIFIRRKQSAAEPNSDERDKTIQLRSVFVAFVSIAILLAIAAIVPRFIIGLTGKIEVWMLSFINVVIFLIALLIYNIAVLVQYRLGGKEK